MSTRASRSTQKELRQPDEFVTATGKVVEWARENPDTVTYGAVGAVVLLLAIIGFSWWSNSRDANAGRQFYSAIELYQAEQWSEAYDGFAKLAGDLGGTAYGNLAKVYAGRAALKLDKPAEAIPFYRDFLADAPDVALEQLARLNLARGLEATGDAHGARSELDRALELAGPARPEVVLELAGLEESAGNRERALELYGRYLTDEPQGAGKELARNRILALGGTPPETETPGFGPGGRNPLQLQ